MVGVMEKIRKFRPPKPDSRCIPENFRPDRCWQKCTKEASQRKHTQNGKSCTCGIDTIYTMNPPGGAKFIFLLSLKSRGCKMGRRCWAVRVFRSWESGGGASDFPKNEKNERRDGFPSWRSFPSQARTSTPFGIVCLPSTATWILSIARYIHQKHYWDNL